MKFWAFITDDKQLKPLNDHDAEQWQKVKRGQLYHVELKQPRNGQFHRKLFALLNLGFENQDWSDNFNHYRAVTLMHSGLVDQVVTPKGVAYLPKSISYAKMDSTEFEQTYDAVLRTIGKQLKTAPDEIANQLNEF